MWVGADGSREQGGSLLNRFSGQRVQKQDYELTTDDARLYREYTAWLAHRNMVDFDDLVAKAEELLRARGDIADAIAARWDYLLVDEFQDVNAVQYDLLKRLAAPHGNFFAVGDDEQSIFTWTGADPYVLVRFSRDYEIERPIVLDKNCRCSRQIFETARRVLAQNPQLFEKQLSAEQESPYQVGAFAFRDEDEEASWLLQDILADRAAAGLGWGDYAVLYRRHQVGESLDGRLVRAGLPGRLARGRPPRALPPLVDEILSQSVGPYKNALEERHDELTDPAAHPEAVRLAERLAAAIAAERDIVIEPQDGLEIALRGMLAAAGVRHLP